MTYRLIRKVIQQTPTILPLMMERLDKRHLRGKDIAGQQFKEALLLMHALPAMQPSKVTVAAMPNLISDRRRREELAIVCAHA
jgi:hypothetical protein